MQPDFAGDQIDLLIVVQLQIHHAVLAEAWDRNAGLRIQRDQPVARRDIEDAFLLAVGPVGQAAARKLPRRCRAARAFILAVHPHQFARGGIERDDRAARPGRGVEHAVDHQRRGFELIFGPRTQTVGLEAPGDFQLVEVVRR